MDRNSTPDPSAPDTNWWFVLNRSPIPTPTGYLHVGHARTFALAAHRAQRAGGTLVYRTEDLDAARCRPEFAAAAMADLRWLGLAWDGEPLRQSARSAVYAAALSRLEDAGHAYPCFCTPEALEAQRRAQAFAGRPPRYDGTSRLSPHLHFGELSPRQVWTQVGKASERAGMTRLA